MTAHQKSSDILWCRSYDPIILLCRPPTQTPSGLTDSSPGLHRTRTICKGQSSYAPQSFRLSLSNMHLFRFAFLCVCVTGAFGSNVAFMRGYRCVFVSCQLARQLADASFHFPLELAASGRTKSEVVPPWMFVLMLSDSQRALSYQKKHII